LQEAHGKVAVILGCVVYAFANNMKRWNMSKDKESYRIVREKVGIRVNYFVDTKRRDGLWSNKKCCWTLWGAKTYLKRLVRKEQALKHMKSDVLLRLSEEGKEL
jgi:hypothetical protein